MENRILRQAARAVGVGALGASLVYSAAFVGAADHLDAPSVSTDGRTDINDLYAFQSPTDVDNTVLIMTVNPLAGVRSGTTFDSKAEYAFNVDSTGDAVADRIITVDFKVVNKKGQRYTVRIDGDTVAQGMVGTTTPLRKIDGQVTAGVFDDPFFFDLNGFLDGAMFSGDDTFAGWNVSAIVLELPSNQLATENNIGVWATTTNNEGQQIDRIGRPAVNTVLIPSARKDEFNTAEPADDFANFGADVSATIAALNGGDTATADVLTGILLPDVLTFDTSSAAGFLNGRGLTDDVIDAELGLLTNGALTGDGVDANDVDFAGTFPYLATAH